MNLNQRVTAHLLITGLIALICALLISIGFAYYADSTLSNKTDAEFAQSTLCRLVDAVPIGSRIGNVEAASSILCGVAEQRTINALSVKHKNDLRIIPTEKNGRVFDSASDANNVFVLFQLPDASKCGYHYELLHVTSKDTVRIGIIPVCSPIVRLSITRDYVSLLAPSSELSKGYMQAYSYNFKARRWVTS